MWYANDCGNPATFLTMGDTLVITPTQSLVVHVRAESALSYTHCSSVMITVEQPITVTALPVDSLCAGTPIELSAYGATCYQWTGPGGFYSLEQNTVAPSDTLVGTLQYVVTGYSAMGACSATDTVTVEILTVPPVSWNITPPSCHGIADGVIEADSLSAVELEFHWIAYGTQGPLIDGLGPDTLVVSITTAFGCTALDTVVIIGPPHPLDSLTIQQATCGSANGSIAVHLHPDALAPTVDWPALGLEGTLVEDLLAGVHECIITDTLGCSYTITVVVPDTGQINVSFLPDTLLIPQGGQVMLFPNVTPAGQATQYDWSPATGLDCTDCSSPQAAPTSSTTYTVVVTSVQGCEATATVRVEVEEEEHEEEEEEEEETEEEEEQETEEQPDEPTVIRCPELFIPSMFSPNGDGHNDHFGVLGGCLREMHLTIHDRWGDLVFETREQHAQWDGLHRGRPLNGGMALYLFKAIDEDGNVIDRSGIITLIR